MPILLKRSPSLSRPHAERQSLGGSRRPSGGALILGVRRLAGALLFCRARRREVGPLIDRAPSEFLRVRVLGRRRHRAARFSPLFGAPGPAVYRPKVRATRVESPTGIHVFDTGAVLVSVSGPESLVARKPRQSR